MSSFSPSWEGYFNAKTVGHKKKWLSLHGMTISGSKVGFHQDLETWKRQIGKNWSTGKSPLQLLDPSNCTFPFITPMHMAYSKKKSAYLKCHNVAKLTLNICNRSFNLTLKASEALPPMENKVFHAHFSSFCTLVPSNNSHTNGLMASMQPKYTLSLKKGVWRFVHYKLFMLFVSYNSVNTPSLFFCGPI